jgi:hypothetical protein
MVATTHDEGSTERDPVVMRLALFGAQESWHELDRVLRSTMPVYAGQAGSLATWLGRRGAGPAEERVVASVWSSMRALDQATDIVELVTAHGPAGTTMTPTHVEVIPVRIRETFERDRPMTILRLYQGRTRPGELELYLEEARAGTRLDGARPDGPGTLVCASDGEARFVTVSLWPDWAAIEACTGGDIQRPLATRNATRIEDGAPSHYELVPTDRPA